MDSSVPDWRAKKTPRNAAEIRYAPTLWLKPPMTTLTVAASEPRIRTPRRLQRSAITPDGTSRTGTTTAYTDAMSPIDAEVKPIVVMNSFSIGTHRARFCRNVARYRGPRRRRRTCGSARGDACVAVPSAISRLIAHSDGLRERSSSTSTSLTPAPFDPRDDETAEGTSGGVLRPRDRPTRSPVQV